MQLIQLETKIATPPERCFLLSLNIDLHMQSTEQTSEVAIAGVTHGIIGPGENGHMARAPLRLIAHARIANFQVRPTQILPGHHAARHV